MIISWFTDPAKGNFGIPGNEEKFSSYYQYDTTSKEFTRVRLELGRTSGSGDTQAMFKETRYVGFSTEKIRTSSDWTVEAGQLKYKGVALETVPTEGDYVYDLTNPTSKPHFGNPVTSEANLPEGIEVKHLNLIANDAMVSKSSVVFTTKAASGAELAEVLKGEVAMIVGKPFASITDADILTTLKAQVTELKSRLISEPKTSIEESLSAVEETLSEINNKIMEGDFVPTQECETAYSDLQKSAAGAKAATSSGDVKTAISEIANAQESLVTVVNTIEEAQHEAIRSSLEASSTSLEEASNASLQWDAIQAEYTQLETASSVEEYESEIGVEEPVEI